MSTNERHAALNLDATAAGERLRTAERENRLIEPVRNSVADTSEEQAKSIQRSNVAHWVNEGRRVVGAKVGITSLVAQEQFGISSPKYGSLFADMLSTDGAVIDFECVPQLRVEAEIAFVLRDDIEVIQPTMVDVISAIDYGLPAVELASSRIQNWDVTLFDFVADNAAASKVVIGETPFDPRSFDVRTVGSITTLNGSKRSFGSGGAYLGSPLQSLLWLARERVRDGCPLRRGDIVMTGALGPIISAGRGTCIDVRIGSLPQVTVEIA